MLMMAIHILNDKEHCLCAVEALSLKGMRVRRIEAGPGWGQPRHVWLQFELPDEGSAIRALATLDFEDAPAAVRGYHFKYLNPQAEARLLSFLTAEAPALAA